jgi:hypothetical protein
MKGVFVEQYLITIIGGLALTLCGIISWIGVRIFNKLDEVSRDQANNYRDFCNRLDGLYSKVLEGDNALHGRVTEMDRRLTRVEAHCSAVHLNGGP